MNRITLPLLAVSLAGILPGAGVADAAAGAELFQLHCATCHGATAEGNGPMAAILTLQPADLTALASGNDDVFPVRRAVARIEGTDPLVAHGSPMPIYAPLFGAWKVRIRDENGDNLPTSRPVRDLVDYLTTIQD